MTKNRNPRPASLPIRDLAAIRGGGTPLPAIIDPPILGGGTPLPAIIVIGGVVLHP
jgi:hypothetical protein